MATQRRADLHLSRLITRGLILLVLAPLAGAAMAAQVALYLPAGEESLRKPLRAISLSIETAARDQATVQDILAAAQADYARLAGALYARGRYAPEISVRIDGREAAEIAPLRAPATIANVVIRVQPGPLFTFSRATIAPLAPGTRLPPDYRAGKPAFSGLIEEAGKAGIDGWRAQGHAKARLAAQRIIADHRTARLESRLMLAPGPRLRFGTLRLKSKSRVRPERVRAIAGLPDGVFSPHELERAANRLRRSGAFRSVALKEARAIAPGNRLDIDASLIDAKPHRFGFGAELSSLEGLKLSGFWLHRNLLGGAERLRIEGEISGIGGDSGGVDATFATRFERPATLTPDTALFLEGRAKALDDPDYQQDSLRLGGGLTHEFSDVLRAEAGLAYQFSDITDDLGRRRLKHLLMPLSATRDSRDNPLDATRGTYFAFDATPFAEIDSATAGARLFLDARSYLAIGAGDRLIFATRAQLGTIAGAGADEVPSDMLFFSGGAGTVRGQPYKSLGVPLGAGLEVGGRSLAAVSVELRARVSEKWSVVGFADGGLVGADSWWKDEGRNHYGAGLGLRYATGLGPIRVDLATPLGSDAGKRVELYIGIGQAF